MLNSSENIKKLYRSKENKIFGGVCGGIGEYLNIDPVVVRILWFLTIFLGGVGLLLYLFAWIIVPFSPYSTTTQLKKNSTKTFGFILILIGVLCLLSNLDIFPIWNWIDWWDIFSWGTIISLLIIGLGIMLVFNYFKYSTDKDQVETKKVSGINIQESEGEIKKILKCSLKDKKLFGVCGGIAEYFDIDSTIVRLIFILLALGSFGLGLFLYLILAIVIPQEKLISIKGNSYEANTK